MSTRVSSYHIPSLIEGIFLSSLASITLVLLAYRLFVSRVVITFPPLPVTAGILIGWLLGSSLLLLLREEGASHATLLQIIAVSITGYLFICVLLTVDHIPLWIGVPGDPLKVFRLPTHY